MLLLVPCSARGEVSDKEQAGRLFQQANKLRDDAAYGPALKKYRAAYKLYKSYKIELNMALALQLMGRHVEAAEAFEKFLWTGRGKISDKMKNMALAKLGKLSAKLGRLRVITIEGDAEVVANGLRRGTAGQAWPFYFVPGKYTINVMPSGRPPVIKKVELVAGAAAELQLDNTTGQPAPPAPLAPQPEPKQPSDEAASTQPTQPPPMDQAVPVGDDTQPTAEPAQISAPGQSDTRSTLAWVSLGMTVACAAAAGAMYGVGVARSDEAYAEYNALTGADPVELFDEKWAEVEAAEQLYVGGHVLAGAAAVAAGATIYLFVTRKGAAAPPAESQAMPQWGVTIDSRHVGLSVSGLF